MSKNVIFNESFFYRVQYDKTAVYVIRSCSSWSLVHRAFTILVNNKLILFYCDNKNNIKIKNQSTVRYCTIQNHQIE